MGLNDPHCVAQVPADRICRHDSQKRTTRWLLGSRSSCYGKSAGPHAEQRKRARAQQHSLRDNSLALGVCLSLVRLGRHTTTASCSLRTRLKGWGLGSTSCSLSNIAFSPGANLRAADRLQCYFGGCQFNSNGSHSRRCTLLYNTGRGNRWFSSDEESAASSHGVAS